MNNVWMVINFWKDGEIIFYQIEKNGEILLFAEKYSNVEQFLADRGVKAWVLKDAFAPTYVTREVL